MAGRRGRIGLLGAALGLLVGLYALDVTPQAGAHRFMNDSPTGKGTTKWPKTRGLARITYATRGKNLAGPARRAARSWNASGARIRFRKVPWRKAKLRISYSNRMTFGSCGYAFRHSSVSFVNGRRSNPTPIFPWQIYMNPVLCGPKDDRAKIAFVIAHEMGHILGLAHETKRCAVMQNPAVIMSPVGAKNPNGCKHAPPGRWYCRLITRDDIRGVVKLYGGRLRRARSYCPIFPDVVRLPKRLALLVSGTRDSDDAPSESWTGRVVLRRRPLEDSPQIGYSLHSGRLNWTVEGTDAFGCEISGNAAIELDGESHDLEVLQDTEPRRDRYSVVSNEGFASVDISVPVTVSCPFDDEGEKSAGEHFASGAWIDTGIRRGNLRKPLSGERSLSEGSAATTWEWTIKPLGKGR